MDHTIYAALAIIYKIDDTKPLFLLLKHISGHWTFAGGGKDPNDKTLQDTLIREIKEEIGVDINESEIINTNLFNKFIYDNKKPERAGKTGETHFYLVKLSGNETFNSFDKISDYGWFVKEKVLELIPYPKEREIFINAVELI